MAKYPCRGRRRKRRRESAAALNTSLTKRETRNLLPPKTSMAGEKRCLKAMSVGISGPQCKNVPTPNQSQHSILSLSLSLCLCACACFTAHGGGRRLGLGEEGLRVRGGGGGMGLPIDDVGGGGYGRSEWGVPRAVCHANHHKRNRTGLDGKTQPTQTDTHLISHQTILELF